MCLQINANFCNSSVVFYMLLVVFIKSCNKDIFLSSGMPLTILYTTISTTIFKLEFLCMTHIQVQENVTKNVSFRNTGGRHSCTIYLYNRGFHYRLFLNKNLCKIHLQHVQKKCTKKLLIRNTGSRDNSHWHPCIIYLYSLFFDLNTMFEIKILDHKFMNHIFIVL